MSFLNYEQLTLLFISLRYFCADLSQMSQYGKKKGSLEKLKG